MSGNQPEIRFDRYGKFTLMAEADGYVMARRPGRLPFVVSRKEWDSWPRQQDQARNVLNVNFRRQI